MSEGANGTRDTTLSFESLDAVAVYTTMRDALQKGGRGLHVGMLVYFWGRLAGFSVKTGAISAEDDQKYVESALSLLAHPDAVATQRLAERAEAEALGVNEGAPNNLMIVGYLSAVSYLFRYLQTSDWKWANNASDSFLSAIDEYADQHEPDALRNEMLNLSRGYETAQSLTDLVIADSARTIVRWASSSPVGSILPPFPGIA